MDKQIIVYEPTEQVKMEVKTDGETVWLTIDQMAMLFGRDKSVIGKHVRNVFAEGELPEEGFRQILPKISVVGGRPSALARNPAKPRLRPTVGRSSWFETRKRKRRAKNMPGPSDERAAFWYNKLGMMTVKTYGVGA